MQKDVDNVNAAFKYLDEGSAFLAEGVVEARDGNMVLTGKEENLRVGCCGFPMARAAYYRRFLLTEVQRTFYPDCATSGSTASRAAAIDTTMRT